MIPFKDNVNDMQKSSITFISIVNEEKLQPVRKSICVITVTVPSHVTHVTNQILLI